MDSFVQKIRRWMLDNSIPASVIPRTDCIRIMNRVDYDPEINITIYLEQNASADNEVAKQYSVRVVDKQYDPMSFTELCALIKKVVRDLYEVR